ncbi:MAG: hypothetical protein ACYTGW_07520 [Planctomycetota bacterium]
MTSSQSAPRSNKAGRVPVARVPRAVSGFNDDDVLVSGGSIQGQGFGRCGGRVLGSRLEQQVCDLLSRQGITHSHSPRHFEVLFEDDSVAAYAPMIVLRGRGRGGKTVVIECAEELDRSVLTKITAFRQKYGPEFYLIFVAPEEIVDLIPRTAYDESSTTTDMGTLINRLAD